jgi:hypothetical protein
MNNTDQLMALADEMEAVSAIVSPIELSKWAERLRALVAQPEGEAVAWLTEYAFDALRDWRCQPGGHVGKRTATVSAERGASAIVPLYATPQPERPQGGVVDAVEVFRIAGGDTECCPNPTAAEALACLRDLRECYDEALSQPAQGKHIGWFNETQPGVFHFIAGTVDPRTWHDNGKPYHHALAALSPPANGENDGR